MKKGNVRLAFTLLFLVSAFFVSCSFIIADSSVSISTPQYFNPSYSGGFQFSNLISGVVNPNSPMNQFYDMELYIPPFGCNPKVIRSDLLESQDVPVFCEVDALKINPGVDITRIDGISARKTGNNDYILGNPSFYPSEAAIQSRNSLVNTPLNGNLGYVVVVIKKQPTENQMPDNISTTLSAYVTYGSKNSFGIGETYFYLPVISDSEFTNSRSSYSFFKGIGYLKVDSVDTGSATISIYDSYNAEMRRVFSDRIEKGKSSRDFYLNTPTGGQGVRIVLNDIGLPKTKARLSVDGKIMEVYEGQKFAETCQVTDLVSYGGDTGFVKIACDGEIQTLSKLFGNVQLSVQSETKSFSVGSLIYTPDANNKASLQSYIYLLYVGTIAPKNEESFVVVYKSDKELTDDVINKKKLEISRQAKVVLSKETLQKSLDGDYLVIGTTDKTPAQFDKKEPSIKFNDSSYSDKVLDSNVAIYYQKAKDAYENIFQQYKGTQNPNGAEYASDALWQIYNLAVAVGKNSEATATLSRIQTYYPNSKNPANANGVEYASTILAKNKLYSSEGSSTAFKSGKVVNLISVNEPSVSQASVSLKYSAKSTNTGGFTGEKQAIKGDVINVGDSRNTILEITDFNEQSASIKYSCDAPKGSNSATKLTGTATIREKATADLTNCDGAISLNKLSFSKFAQIQVVPILSGKSKENNFTFSISIEKRPAILQLTPEEESQKVKELNETIDRLQNITDKLGKVVKAGNIACLATAGFVNLKTLLSGASSVRLKAMTDEGGWNDICKELSSKSGSNYKNIDACISDSSPKIDKDIAGLTKVSNDINTQYNLVVKANTDSKTGQINYNKVSNNLINGGVTGVTSLISLAPKNLIDENGASQTQIGKEDISSIIQNRLSTGANQPQLRDLKLDLMIVNDKTFSEEYRNSASKKAYSILSNVVTTSKSVGNLNSLTDSGIPLSAIANIPVNNPITTTYTPLTWEQVSKPNGAYTATPPITGLDKTALVGFIAGALGKTYLVTLKQSSDVKFYSAINFYKIDNQNIKEFDAITEAKEKQEAETLATRVVWEKADPSKYQNKCLGADCTIIEVFNLAPYKGQPALIPFDNTNGWYVYVKNSIPVLGTKSSYQDSGNLNSFYVCNVGANKIINRMAGDDECRGFNLYTGEALNQFAGLSPSETKNIVAKAMNAVSDAQRQLASNPNGPITINGVSLTVRGSEGRTGSKCTDFMSPSDCRLLFNVCDPFICPASRCDFGGQFPVDNVISSGIVGSTLLCLPNFPETLVPVCLTGINAGLEAWTSVVKGYRDCVATHLATNQTVGLCDEVRSVYICDLFWKELGPSASMLAKNIFTTGALFGQKDRGGGEYLLAQDAWNNAEKSWQYFTSSYAAGTNLGVGFQSFSEVGSELCKARLSLTYPNKVGEMFEAQSPVQINAWFSENEYTSATTPATSQYKVFYTIYAGNNEANYQVYLKQAPTSFGYAGKGSSVVDTGYIAKGGYKSETKNFLDVAGFKTICVVVNNKEHCGFGKVSTSFAMNTLADSVASQQAITPVKTEQECVSGTASFSGFLTSPNLQTGAENSINPQIYNSGIIRICATSNPAKGTSDEGKWTNVGYCDNPNMKCWLSQDSIKNALNSQSMANLTIAQLNNMTLNNLVAQGKIAPEIGKTLLGNIEKAFDNIVGKIIKGNKDSIGSLSDSVSLDGVPSKIATLITPATTTTTGTAGTTTTSTTSATITADGTKSFVQGLSGQFAVFTQTVQLNYDEAEFYRKITEKLNEISAPPSTNVPAAGTSAVNTGSAGNNAEGSSLSTDTSIPIARVTENLLDGKHYFVVNPNEENLDISPVTYVLTYFGNNKGNYIYVNMKKTKFYVQGNSIYLEKNGKDLRIFDISNPLKNSNTLATKNKVFNGVILSDSDMSYISSDSELYAVFTYLIFAEYDTYTGNIINSKYGSPVSQAPESPNYDEILANGFLSLADLANLYDLPTLKNLNPELVNKYGASKPIPQGTVIAWGIKEPSRNCIDSDEKDTSRKGTVSETDGILPTLSDSCLIKTTDVRGEFPIGDGNYYQAISSCSLNNDNCYLVEYFCDTNFMRSSSFYKCSSCSDGAGLSCVLVQK